MMKNFILIFLVFSIFIGALSKINANTNEDSCSDDSDDHNTNWYQTTQNQYDQDNQDEDNFSKRHQQKPQGYDSYVAIIKEEFRVYITSKSLLLDQQQSFQGVTNVFLNEHSLFIFLKQSQQSVEDYRNNVLSINLSELASETDIIAQNICCDNIDTIFRDLTQDGVHCFRIEAPQAVWQICGTGDRDQHRLEQFRLQLILHVMRATGEQINHALLIVEPLYEDPSQWSWGDQENWKHTCKSGVFQSPIVIDKKHSLQKDDYEFVWNYHNSTTQNAVASYNGKQVEINGDFGNIELTINYDDRSSKYNYQAKKIKFNFAQEHQIVCPSDDEDETGKIIGEMQVYHETQDGDRAIVSFLLTDDHDALQNEFIEQLDASYFIPQAGFSQQLTYKPNINSIVESGALQFYDKSFFLYSGSETTPPCQEGLIRIVMKTPIRVNAAQLTPLVANTFNGEINPTGVTRSTQPLNLRHVFYYQDQSCDLPTETLKMTKRVQKKIQTQNQIFDSHFVSENQQREFITYVPKLHHDPSFISEDGKLKIEKVDPSSLDQETLKELQDGLVIENQVDQPNEEQRDDQIDQDQGDEEEQTPEPKKRKYRFSKRSRIARHRRRRRF